MEVAKSSLSLRSPRYPFHNTFTPKLQLILSRAPLPFALLHVRLANIVHLPLLNQREQAGALIVESRCADLSRFVHEGDGEELALTAGIGPGFDVGFVDGAGADHPAGSERSDGWKSKAQTKKRKELHDQLPSS